jgi:tetratricopeptide (TPR) repeat protein
MLEKCAQTSCGRKNFRFDSLKFPIIFPDNPKTLKMRPILILFIGGTLIASAQNPTAAQQAQQFYKQGIAQEQAGNVEGARTAYTQALRLNPHFADARFRLGQLKMDRGQLAAKAREKKFGALIIPQMNLDGATVAESLEALRISMEKVSNGEVAPNFVLKDPDRKLEKTSVTFQLKSVPAKAILDYILSQGYAKAVFDEHAVVIEPIPGPGLTSPGDSVNGSR